MLVDEGTELKMQLRMKIAENDTLLQNFQMVYIHLIHLLLLSKYTV